MAELFTITFELFSLISRGVSLYGDAINPLDTRATLRGLSRELEMERAKFENTCEYILEEVVPSQVVKTLVGGEGWNEPTLQDALKRCFCPAVAKAFMEAVDTLHLTLRGLSKDLGLEDNHQVCILTDPQTCPPDLQYARS